MDLISVTFRGGQKILACVCSFYFHSVSSGSLVLLSLSPTSHKPASINSLTLKGNYSLDVIVVDRNGHIVRHDLAYLVLSKINASVLKILLRQGRVVDGMIDNIIVKGRFDHRGPLGKMGSPLFHERKAVFIIRHGK